MARRDWRIVNPTGAHRVVVTKDLPGERWRRLLSAADCRVEIAQGPDVLGQAEIRGAIGDRVDAVIGQLTEHWSAPLLEALAAGGGAVYSQYAVGYDNVDVQAATRLGLPVGNTPGVLTETTAELAVALTFAAARRIAEGDRVMRAGGYHGWLPDMLLGSLLYGRTLGVVGAGRIGAAYARMMVEGHKMNLVYYDVHGNEDLERYVADYGAFLTAHGEQPVRCRRAGSLPELLGAADVVSIHAALTESTLHLIGAPELAAMKDEAVLVNASRGQLCRRGRPRRALPLALTLPRRHGRVRARAGHGAGPCGARQRRHGAAPRLGDDLDARGHGHPGRSQCRRDAQRLAGVAGRG